MAVGRLFFLKTSWKMLVMAMVMRLVVGAPFQHTRFPQMSAMAAFHPSTAQGKLKAVITPIIPSGFHYSIMK